MVLPMWNVRGFNGSKIKRELLTLMAKKNLDIVGLLVIRVRRKNQAKVLKMFDCEWQGILNINEWELDKRDSIRVMWDSYIWSGEPLITKMKGSRSWSCLYMAEQNCWKGNYCGLI